MKLAEQEGAKPDYEIKLRLVKEEQVVIKREEEERKEREEAEKAALVLLLCRQCKMKLVLICVRFLSGRTGNFSCGCQ